jgi:hypothetical protein
MLLDPLQKSYLADLHGNKINGYGGLDLLPGAYYILLYTI